MRPVCLAILIGSVTLMSCSEPSLRHTASSEPVTPAKDPAMLMSWADLTRRPLPSPTTSRRYAPHESGLVDIWIPDTAPPHPVIVMIHGGCWQKAIADRTLMNYAAEDLRSAGLAVWNIEYRGVDEAGGGFPGTFKDVSQAVDLLGLEGPDLGLDVSNLVAFGHSAGGHLAGWVAARANLPPDSPLSGDVPVSFGAVINSGGLADLAASKAVTLPSCLSDIMDRLTGTPEPGRRNVLEDTSVASLLPLPARLINVSGDRDRISPPHLGRSLTEKARASGGVSAYYELADSGHVELIAPGTEAFEVQKRLMMSLLSDSLLPEAEE